jgi:hypothetical protein
LYQVLDIRYDGKGIGEHIGDAIRPIRGLITLNQTTGLVHYYGAICIGAFDVSGTYYYSESRLLSNDGGGVASSAINFDSDKVVPGANENRPASISYYPCIKY